jgi:hypothetical protein
MALSFVTAASSVTATVVMPGGMAAGMIAVLFDEAVNNTTTVPTSLIPTNWSLSASFTAATFNSNASGVRFNISWKILVGTESGQTITGMTGIGTGNMDKVCLVFSGTAGAFGTPLSVLGQVGSPPVTAQVVAAVTPAGVMLGCNTDYFGGTHTKLVMLPAATATRNDNASMEAGYVLYTAAAVNNRVSTSGTSDGALVGLWVPFTDVLMGQGIM